ncbi:TPA: hypothetical protein U1W51_002190 [Streptococcus suis]|nr:hypothetical protein [Streptococcus suis]HEM4138553.1 hypothetical protein [Streptococcus suis]HEM5031566.1 hypothetical protein [Streptococcus suis]HEM5047986.1 hypothetical protein [Streptococcus suis]HEM5085977.1 hypothetical protein [Streptococcus suis]
MTSLVGRKYSSRLSFLSSYTRLKIYFENSRCYFSALDYAFPMENSRAEILFTLGQNDQLVDQVALEHLVDDWQASVFPKANLVRFDKGHFLSQDELTYIKNWYQERIDKKT